MFKSNSFKPLSRNPCLSILSPIVICWIVHICFGILLLFYTYITRYPRDARGIMVIVFGSRLGDPSSILDKAVCISYSTNILGKGMNPNILILAMGK